MPNLHLHRHSSQPTRTSRETNPPNHATSPHRNRNLLHHKPPPKSNGTGKERQNLMSSVAKLRKKLLNSTGSTPSLHRPKTHLPHHIEPKNHSDATTASHSRRCSPRMPTSMGSSIAVWTESGAPPIGKSSALP
jgi:hypothetical protein